MSLAWRYRVALGYENIPKRITLSASDFVLVQSNLSLPVRVAGRQVYRCRGCEIQVRMVITGRCCLIFATAWQVLVEEFSGLTDADEMLRVILRLLFAAV